MTPPVQRKWSVAKLGCGCAAAAAAAILVVVLAFVVGGAALVAAWFGGDKWRKDEHAAWPRPTPSAALATRSPTGRFITSAGKHSGDGLDKHDDRYDCIRIAPAACPDAAQEFTAQDHAWCETDERACRESDGKLMGERFGVALRWINATDVEVSWTELAALDPAKHRIWGRASATYRVTEIPTDRTGPCERSKIHVEDLPSAPGR